mgnify:CR=1 FL=1
MNYYIADYHFFHKNVTAEGTNIDNRPFKTMDEMMDIFRGKWIETGITYRDDVFFIGDLCWKEGDLAVELISSLPGNKYLVRGNHDRCKNQGYTGLFKDISPYADINDSGRRLILCHYPIAFWNAQHRGSIHLYGHVHNSVEELLYQKFLSRLDFSVRAYNVGCMMPYMNWSPQTLDTIITRADMYYGRV